MKIVVLDRSSVGGDVSVEELRRYGEVDFYDSTPDGQVPARIEDSHIIVNNKYLLNAASLKAAPKVELICQFATGYDNVDVEYCRSRSIGVANVRNYSTMSVVQHTVALALSLLENLPYYDRYVKSGAYAGQPRFSHFAETYYELDGKTWGIVGMGNIGRGVARAAEALGCRVIFYSASGNSACTDYERVSFQELLARSDILSLHCPLSQRTRNLIDAAALHAMKKEAILINVARGAVVDNAALAQALQEGEIRAAGLDVFVPEPMRPDDPLLLVQDTGKLQMTPHMAWASTEARVRCVEETCRNIEAYLRGEMRNRIV